MKTIRCTVDSRVRLNREDLNDHIIEELRVGFEHRNPKFFKMKAMRFPTYGEPAKIATWRSDDQEVSVPRGGMKRVREAAKRHGYRLDVTDERSRGRELPSTIISLLELRGYQETAKAAMLRRENCLITSPTGSGKTSLCIAAIPSIGRWTLILVDARGIADEWLKRTKRELNITDEQMGYIGEGVFRLAPVTIGLQQALYMNADDARWARISECFGAVICDEVQTLAARTFRETLGRIPAQYRIGVSDDYRRPDKMEFLIEDEFGEVAHAVPEAELIEGGAVLGVSVVLLPTQFAAPWYRRPGVPVAGKANRLLEEICADDVRNEQIVDRVVDEVAAGHRFLMFSHRVDHCRVLEAMLDARGVPVGMMVGEGRGAKQRFRETHAGLEQGTVKVGVGTLKSLGKGVNLPSVDRGFATTPVATSEQPWRQVRGRICRPKAGGGDAQIWYAWDLLPLGKKPAHNLVRWNRGTSVQVWTPGGMIDAKQYLKEM